jgi:hypothetical protein
VLLCVIIRCVIGKMMEIFFKKEKKKILVSDMPSMIT